METNLLLTSLAVLLLYNQNRFVKIEKHRTAFLLLLVQLVVFWTK